MRGVLNRSCIGDKGDLYENRTNVLDFCFVMRYNVYAVGPKRIISAQNGRVGRSDGFGYG